MFVFGGERMEYVLASLALLALAIKGGCGKKVSFYVGDTGDSFLFNIVRLLFCMAIGALLVLFGTDAGNFAIDGGMLLICLFSGVCNAMFLGGWMLAVCHNSMVMVDVSLTIGSILPAILSTAFFGEEFSWLRMIGFALILAAVFILAGYNKEVKKGVGLIGIVTMVIAALGDGLTGFGQQLYRQFYTAEGLYSGEVLYSKSVYNFYIYVFAALALGLFYLFYAARHRGGCSFGERLKNTTKPLPFIAIMAGCLFAATYLQTVCLGDYGMSSQILYPLMKGGCLILVNFTAMIFFGEKMTRRSIFGSAVALLGIVILNVL